MSLGGRRRRTFAFAVVATAVMFLTVAAVAAVAPPARAADPQGYVALGDSYSAGEGLGRYLDDDGACHRSERAYPALVQAPGTGESWYDLRATAGWTWGTDACSGARVADVLADQLGVTADPDNPNFRRLDAATALVTVTAGGNDAGFSRVLVFCGLGHTHCADEPYDGADTLEAWRDARLADLHDDLVGLYTEIRRQAPNARILVLGYPQLFPKGEKRQNCLSLKQRTLSYLVFSGGRLVRRETSILFSHDELRFLRGSTSKLNATLRRAVADAGVGARFVPVTSAFASHQICGSGDAWIYRPGLALHLTSPYVTVARRSFHPNRDGQRAYAEVIDDVLAGS